MTFTDISNAILSLPYSTFDARKLLSHTFTMTDRRRMRRLARRSGSKFYAVKSHPRKYQFREETWLQRWDVNAQIKL